MIVSLVMLRDEADILPVWLRHMAKFCDRILAVDHLSNDGSSEILRHFTEAGYPIRYWRMDEPGYWQSAVSTELARHAFQSGAEWILPFDVDEFLELGSKEELQAILDRQKNPLGFWRWRHAAPTTETLATGQLDWSALKLLANPKPAPANGGKVVLHRSIYEKLPGFRLGSGNHLLHGVPFAKAIRGNDMGTLWHLPVRSREQILRKLRRDVASHSNAKATSLPELGRAARLKAQLLQRILESTDDVAALQRMGLGYGEMGIRCLDDAKLLSEAVLVSPRLAMAQVAGTPVEMAIPKSNPASAISQQRTDHALARAQLSRCIVEIIPERAWPRLLFALEDKLAKFFTPGFRLARFMATRFVAWRLGMSERAKDGAIAR